MNERDVLDILANEYRLSEWVFIRHLRTETGFSNRNLKNVMSPRVIDGFAFNCWPSNAFWRMAFEVKVSQKDFDGELANPAKHLQGFYLSNQFYFVLGPGVWDEEKYGHYFAPHSLFSLCGVMFINDEGELERPRKFTAAKRMAHPIPEGMVLSALRDVATQYKNARMEVERLKKLAGKLSA